MHPYALLVRCNEGSRPVGLNLFYFLQALLPSHLQHLHLRNDLLPCGFQMTALSSQAETNILTASSLCRSCETLAKLQLVHRYVSCYYAGRRYCLN
jgi:hypothetical protein